MSTPSGRHPLDVVNLRPLMALTSGRPDVAVGLVDGPVLLGHPDLAGARITEVPWPRAGAGHAGGSPASRHGTFVAGILVARRGSPAPAICPDCTLVPCPIFSESAPAPIPSATHEELAAAIVACTVAGARIVNVSAAMLGRASSAGERDLRAALDHCSRRHVIVVVAAGNHGTIGGSTLTRHPAVLPVAACDSKGRPTQHTNLSATMGKRGVMAPGDQVTSLGAEGSPLRMSGTSAAAPFVTGTLALLWSLYPSAGAAEIRWAARPWTGGRPSLVPPLLEAAASHSAIRARGVDRERGSG